MRRFAAVLACAIALIACGDNRAVPDAGTPLLRDPVELADDPLALEAPSPHFRGDGWIYAQVRDLDTGHEVTIASDAALVAEAAP